MLEIQDEFDSFLSKLKNTQVVKEYEKQREILNQSPELKKSVDDFRQRNYEMQRQMYPDQLFDETDRFEQSNAQLIENQIVQDFLAAELGYCRMVQEVTQRIMYEMSKDFE